MPRKKQTKQLKLEMGENPLKLVVDGKNYGHIRITVDTDSVWIVPIKASGSKSIFVG